MTLENPYAAALDGLEIPDPVAAFFEFCRERERIRQKREAGEPAPWSDDSIFQRGRFLNVFREDDRCSKAIQRFVSPLADDLPKLVQALFFARWCNAQSTLDQLQPAMLQEPETLKKTLEFLPTPPWCNVTAYPVEAISFRGRHISRLDTAVYLFAEIKEEMTTAILSAQGNVVKATKAINDMLGMDNDFPIFMAIIDLAWFRPDVIDPASPVPTGIGAVAYLDRLERFLGLNTHEETCQKMIDLQAQYWPEAKRPFQPIDIEYLACECRKYYSYVNGTKGFEGKNRFIPGQSPRFVFDISASSNPAAEVQTEINVIAGGPCSGKTTLLKALGQLGHRVEVETAERLLKAGIAKGQSAQSMRADPVAWQMRVLNEDVSLFEGLPLHAPVFTDTSVVETVVFAERAGISLGPNMRDWLRKKRYKRVFFLEPIPDYERSEVRMESQALARQLSDQVRALYADYGYTLISIPAMPLKERLSLIAKWVSED